MTAKYANILFCNLQGAIHVYQQEVVMCVPCLKLAFLSIVYKLNQTTTIQ